MILLLACATAIRLGEDVGPGIGTDADQDGWSVEAGDCDDANASVNPGATEACNGIDDNCDGRTDGEDTDVAVATWYRDADEDSYGSNTATQVSCSQPDGYISNSGDCDDDDPTVNAGAVEVCNDIDDDCDAATDGSDPDVVDATTWYLDADGDGSGNAASTEVACHQPDHYVATGDDCDDADPTNACAALPSSCREILESGASSGDGNYLVDPASTAGFEVYCDMTSYGGGWTLVAQGGTLSCSGMSEATSMLDISSCSYLEHALVQSLAASASEVMLRVGTTTPTFGDWTSTARSTNGLAVEALQSPTGTWHNGATWDAWSWSRTCEPVYAVGWPDMYHACGNGSGTHWLAAGYYSHSNNGSDSTSVMISSTWLR